MISPTGITGVIIHRTVRSCGSRLHAASWLLAPCVILLLTVSHVAVAHEDIEEYMPTCRDDLGMNSGAIADSAINASSSYDFKSVGPLNSRIRTEKNGGAWCPQPQVGRDATEWLEIDLGELKVISLVETQGRFGNGQGQEYAPNYMFDYQRVDGGPWFRFRDRKSVELLTGNSNTYFAELRELRPIVIAKRVRFVPYSSHPRTVCMRVELYGCTWTDGVVSYDSRQGDRRGTEMDFYDFTYDGSVSDGQLAGGLGQLSDFETGDTNFRLDGQNLGRKGYEWVGWRNDNGTGSPSQTSRVNIVFHFDQLRNFSAVLIHANNMFSRDVSVFKSAKIYFSVGGVYFTSRPLVYAHRPDGSSESARQVIIPVVPGRVGRAVRVSLQFDLRWIMISEIRFASERVSGSLTFVTEEKPTKEFVSDMLPVDKRRPLYSGPDADAGDDDDDDDDDVPDSQNGAGASDLDVLVGVDADDGVAEVDSSRRRMSDTYVGIVVGVLAVVILFIVVVSIVVGTRLRRRKYSGSGGSPSKFVFSGGDLRHSSVDYSQTLPLGAVRFANGYATNGGEGLMSDKNNVTSAYDCSSKTLQMTALRAAQAMFANAPPPSSADDLNGSGVLEFNVYATLQTSTSDLQHDPPPPFDSGFQIDNDVPVLDSTTSARPTPAQLQPNYSKSSVPADCETTVDGPLLTEARAADSDDPSWDNFSDLEFPRDALDLIDTLGNSSFGEVLLCQANVPDCLQLSYWTSSKQRSQSQVVAVKTLDSRSSKQTQLAFYREVEVMVGLRDPHIVQVLGMCSRDYPLAVVVEYSELGDLHQFLQSSAPDQLTSVIGSSFQTLSYGCLIYMATQIASGMKYLETLNVVHRDLAARNCLVGHKYTIKISDFGVCRSIFGPDYYRVNGATLLPIRWMAWEAVLLNQFTSKSDVWSFAVTLWEILTFARERPFEALTNDQVVDNCARCCAGHQLDVVLGQPANCPREIYDLMVECWNRVEVQRPTFREIHMFLQRKNMGYSPSFEHTDDTKLSSSPLPFQPFVTS